MTTLTIIFISLIVTIIIVGIITRLTTKEQPMTQEQDALIYLTLEAMTKKNIQKMETKND